MTGLLIETIGRYPFRQNRPVTFHEILDGFFFRILTNGNQKESPCELGRFLFATLIK